MVWKKYPNPAKVVGIGYFGNDGADGLEKVMAIFGVKFLGRILWLINQPPNVPPSEIRV